MSKDKSGKSLEKAVARIQQMLDPGSVVTHNEYIIDRLGHRRQFDVVIRGQAAGRDYLGVIEAKDWSTKVGTPEVEAFVMKARYVNANFVLMVSRMGFSEPGLRTAKHEGVGTLSLLPDDPIDAGFYVGLMCYAHRYEWGPFNFGLFRKEEGEPTGVSDIRSITLDGKPVIAWFAKQLSTTYMDATGPEPTLIEVKFKTPMTLQIEGREADDVTRLVIIAQRIRRTKRGFVQITGDAFYDWLANGISWPIGGALQLQVTEAMVNSWEPFTGEIPQKKEFGGLVIEEFIAAMYDEQDVIDLGKYC
jgi:hypothetical protein